MILSTGRVYQESIIFFLVWKCRHLITETRNWTKRTFGNAHVDLRFFFFNLHVVLFVLIFYRLKNKIFQFIYFLWNNNFLWKTNKKKTLTLQFQTNLHFIEFVEKNCINDYKISKTSQVLNFLLLDLMCHRVICTG